MKRYAEMAWKAVRRVLRFSLVRPVQRYNVEERAFKVLDKAETTGKVPRTAPGFPATEKFIKQLQQERPEISEEIATNPAEHLEHLKSVKVTSEGAGESSKERQKDGLPHDRWAHPIPEYGHKETERVMPGRISIRQTIEMIDTRHKDKNTWTFDKLADKYEMDEKHVEMVLEHFKAFQLYEKPKPDKLPWLSSARLNAAFQSRAPEQFLESQSLSDHLKDKPETEEEKKHRAAMLKKHL
jgi:hypothetical protein